MNNLFTSKLKRICFLTLGLHSSFVFAIDKSRNDWCTRPENYTEYKKMVSELNNQISCQVLGPEECKLLIGVSGVGAVYGAAKGTEAYQKNRKLSPAMTCKVSSITPKEYIKERPEVGTNIDEVFVGIPLWMKRFQDTFMEAILSVAEAKVESVCMMSLDSKMRMRKMAETGAREFEKGLVIASKEVEAAESALRAHQQTVRAEVAKLVNSQIKGSLELSKLTSIQLQLAQDSQALYEGWNDFLKDRATRLQKEYQEALAKGNEKAKQILSVEISEFIGSNFSDEVKDKVQGKVQEGRVILDQLNKLLSEAPQDYGKGQNELFKLCQSQKLNCSDLLSKSTGEAYELSQKLADSSRKANIFRAKYSAMVDIAKAADPVRIIQPAQARELMLRLVENIPNRFLISNDIKALSQGVGLSAEAALQLNNTTAGLRHAAIQAGAPVEKVFARNGLARAGIFNLVTSVGTRAAIAGGALLAGATTALASPIVGGAMIYTAAMGDVSECNGSVSTSRFATTDANCVTLPVYNRRTMDLHTSPFDEQMKELTEHPEMCGVLTKIHESTKPSRWEASCQKDSAGRATGYSAKLRTLGLNLQQEAKFNSDGQIVDFRMVDPSRKSRLVKGGFGATINNGEVSEVRFLNEGAIFVTDDPKETLSKALNFRDPTFYNAFAMANYVGKVGKFDSDKKKRISENLILANSQFVANRMPMIEMSACCQGQHDPSRCDQYGIHLNSRGGNSRTQPSSKIQ
ncbi:MAG: hypothetical protein H6625_02695 [Bdellovibrionaceae bacterium]|nr:hypothetical protein [Pseudobdellovibrionaceae bacterium]